MKPSPSSLILDCKDSLVELGGQELRKRRKVGKYNVKGASRVGSKTESLEEVVKIRKRKQETGR